MACAVCGQTPEPPVSRLYLWPPAGHTRAKLRRLLGERSLSADPRLGAHCLVAPIGDLRRFATAVAGALLHNEQQDTRALATDEREPVPGDFARVTTLRDLVLATQGAWVSEVLRDKRYKSVTQPIVALADGTVFAHEFLLRGWEPGGETLTAAAMFGAAREPRLLARLDRAARLSAVQTAATHGLRSRTFVNFTPSAIYEPDQCLRTTVSAVQDAGIEPGRVVFEIVESEKVDDYAHLKGIVNFYRRSGFQIALDDFGTGYNNLEALFALKPDFIKLDIQLTRAAREAGFARSLIGHLVTTAHVEGTRVVAEGIEDRETLILLRELGVDYAQGYYFGRPSEHPLETIDPGLLESSAGFDVVGS